MKKILLAILTLVYLSASVEAAGSLHDCVGVFSNCSTEERTGEEPNLPCSNDVKACEFQIKRKNGVRLLNSQRSSYGRPFPMILAGLFERDQTPFPKLPSWHSPVSGELSLFILYQVFRI